MGSSARTRAGLLAKARAIADEMGWEFEHRPVGYGDLETRLVELMRNGVQLSPKQLTVLILNSSVAGNGIRLIPAYGQIDISGGILK